jgi:hypothetical protein
MNTTLTKFGIQLALAASIGGAIGYLFGQKYLQKLIDDEVAKEQKKYAEEHGEIPEFTDGAKLAKSIIENAIKNDDPIKNWDGTLKEGEEIVVTKEKEMYKKKAKKDTHITDYASLSKKPLSQVAKEVLPEEPVEEKPVTDESEHIVISLDEHALQTGYAKIVLTFYTKDDVLSDEDDKPVLNGDKLIGPDGLLKFGEQSGDPDTVYIRNTKLRTDFEVVQLHKSFAEEVHGIIEEEPKKPAKKKATKPNVKKVTDDDSNEDN